MADNRVEKEGEKKDCYDKEMPEYFHQNRLAVHLQNELKYLSLDTLLTWLVLAGGVCFEKKKERRNVSCDNELSASRLPAKIVNKIMKIAWQDRYTTTSL